MKKRLLRVILACLLVVSIYGIFTSRTTYAQCACACSYLCSGTCNVSCSDCSLSGFWETAMQCCEQEKKNVEQYCTAGGNES